MAVTMLMAMLVLMVVLMLMAMPMYRTALGDILAFFLPTVYRNGHMGSHNAAGRGLLRLDLHAGN